jgi:hypothetical protein
MNTLARSVLTLYSYDENADDISIPNVLRQSLQLIALFPMLSVYGYQAYKHYHDGQSLLYILQGLIYLLRKTSFICFVRTVNTLNWKHVFWILRWCCMQSMEAAITPPLQPMW